MGVGLGVRVSLPAMGGGVDAVEVGWASETVCKHAVGFTLNTWLPAPRVVASSLWGGCCVGCGGFVGLGVCACPCPGRVWLGCGCGGLFVNCIVVVSIFKFCGFV